jgi:hypothetical protein
MTLWPAKYRPMLDLHLDLGFLRVSTAVMRQTDYSMVIEFVALEFRVFKWGFSFRLYDTMQRARDR